MFKALTRHNFGLFYWRVRQGIHICLKEAVNWDVLLAVSCASHNCQSDMLPRSERAVLSRDGINSKLGNQKASSICGPIPGSAM